MAFTHIRESILPTITDRSIQYSHLLVNFLQLGNFKKYVAFKKRFI